MLRRLFIFAFTATLFSQTDVAPPPQAPNLLPEERLFTRKQLSAKTPEEYSAYQAVTSQAELIAADKQASDFASRYPESELREAMYQTLMLRHQAANDAERTLRDAETVLLLNPQNAIALVTAANVLSERTQPTSVDAAARFDRGMRYAERALQIIASGLTLSTEASAEQVSALRNALLSWAYGAEGNIALLRKDYVEAEKHLYDASELTPSNPLVLYRMALAQHGQQRFDDALVNINKAVQAANASRDLLLVERVRQERSTLIKAGARP